MMVDMHHHLVYGVDDGAQTPEQMVDMIDVAYQNGVRCIVTTPHATPGQSPFPQEQYMRHLQEGQAWCAKNRPDMHLYAGAEIFYTTDAPRMLREGYIPTLAGSEYVLVEFSPEAPYAHLESAARALTNAGVCPIFAHVERYRCLRHMPRVRALRDEYEVLMQVNASTFLSPRGFLTKRWLRHMMQEGLVDLAASDAHNTQGRACKMRACYGLIRDEYGPETADRLCGDTARELFQI